MLGPSKSKIKFYVDIDWITLLSLKQQHPSS